MATNMLDKRKQDKNMGSENIYLKIEATMKEDGEIIWCMEREFSISLTAKLSMKDNGQKMSLMAGELTTLILTLQCGANIKDNSEEGKWKAEENSFLLMDWSTKANFVMARYLELGDALLPEEEFSRKIGNFKLLRNF